MRQKASQSSAAGDAYAFAKAPYQNGCEFWPLYLLLHRVGLAALSSLITEPLTKSLCITAWCLSALCAHHAARPFVSTEVGSLQYALLVSLVFISSTGTLEAYKLSAAEEPNQRIESIAQTVKNVQGVLLLLPCLYLVVRFIWKKRRAIQSVSYWEDNMKSEPTDQGLVYGLLSKDTSANADD
jgi:hypothetical protein